MKKIISAIIVGMLLTSLIGCSSEGKYDKAEDYFASGDYASALELYTELGDYEDSQDKVLMCEKEIGMTENADYAFLADIETSILNRMKNSKDEAYDTLVNTELAYLEKYESLEFYDADLKLCADKYIEGLHKQKEALEKEYYYEEQIEWQRGMVLRMEALVSLYEKYDFLSDNAEFIGTYVSQCEAETNILNGYDAIEKDIGNQTEAEDFKWWLDEYNYTFSCDLKNNTEYSFGTWFDIYFYDKEGVMYESDSAYIEGIKPGMTYTVEVYISEPERLADFSWQNYYEYVE